MKLLSSILFSLCLMCTVSLFGEPAKSGCQCRECRCTPQAHCGCYTDQGCRCANPNCQCGPDCACGPDCECGNGRRGPKCKCGPNCPCVKKSRGNGKDQTAEVQRGANFDEYGNKINAPAPSASRSIGGRN